MLDNWGQSVRADKGTFVRKQLETLKWTAPIGMALVIAWLSIAPSDHSAIPSGNDKLGHVLAYGTLTLSAIWAAGWARWIQALMACLAYGAVMEVAQGLMPFGREFSLLDMVANTAGALAALAVFWIWSQR